MVGVGTSATPGTPTPALHRDGLCGLLHACYVQLWVHLWGAQCGGRGSTYWLNPAFRLAALEIEPGDLVLAQARALPTAHPALFLLLPLSPGLLTFPKLALDSFCSLRGPFICDSSTSAFPITGITGPCHSDQLGQSPSFSVPQDLSWAFLVYRTSRLINL